MSKLYETRDDFEADVRILTEREGGRRTPPYNGIRWDLRYFFQGEGEVSMVWPEFIHDTGETIRADQPLSGLLEARFYVINAEMRDFHRQHARPGFGFSALKG
jgi:hypothetical protein